MSSIRPVPDCRLPNSGVAYQLLYHACPSPPLMIPGARFGWSPSDTPSGPYAVAAATSSKPTAAPGAGLARMDALGAGLADPADADAAAVARGVASAAARGVASAAARGVASAAVRAAEGRPAGAVPPEIRS
jgi:hypothetical protein